MGMLLVMMEEEAKASKAKKVAVAKKVTATETAKEAPAKRTKKK